MLYFESFKADEFKNLGFSKDNKSQQPQVVIGLLVIQSGFPLSYEVFSGDTFEGKTMLPIFEKFISEHPHSKPIIVADAAMFDEERLTELQEKGMSYFGLFWQFLCFWRWEFRFFYENCQQSNEG